MKNKYDIIEGGDGPPPDLNGGDNSFAVAQDELRSFIERIENLESEIKDIQDGRKEVYAEAKGRGFDVKIVRKIVALRKKDPSEIAEEEALMDTYRAALGMI